MQVNSAPVSNSSLVLLKRYMLPTAYCILRKSGVSVHQCLDKLGRNDLNDKPSSSNALSLTVGRRLGVGGEQECEVCVLGGRALQTSQGEEICRECLMMEYD